MTDLRERLQTALGDRYTIHRELTGGGMSRVYVATEEALGRQVVIKVLPPDLAAAVSLERFRREILVVARLQHPHIVPVHGAGEADGLPYFTMPLVEGESLRARLARGTVPTDEAIRILRGVASGLAYAHAKGIVHRDIKPDNVLVSDGEALVSDFGVAKAVSASSGSDGRIGPMTTVGVALGTLIYMAPEQTVADPNVDARADIYSFGVMAYELLSGTTPFADRSGAALVTARLTQSPQPLSWLRPDLPAVLTDVVMRCLERDPANRFQGAQELVHALDAIGVEQTPSPPFLTDTSLHQATVQGETPGSADALPPHLGPKWFDTAKARRLRRTRVAVAGMVVSALVVAGVMWQRRVRSTASPPAPGLVRVAVLPFDNLGDSADGYFADGLTDAIRAKLVALPGLEIIAPTSSDQYRRTTKGSRQIGEELGVRYLVIGKVRWNKRAPGPGRVQVSPALIEAATAADKWEQPFDAPLTDVFKVQGDIASQVAGALGIALGAAQQRALTAAPTPNLAAYQAYLRATELERGGEVIDGRALQGAMNLYREAIALDSNYAAALASLAWDYAQLLSLSTPIPEWRDSIELYASRALRLDSTLATAYAARAGNSFLGGRAGWAARALAEARAGLLRAPGSALALTQVARYEQASGDWTNAVAHWRQAVSLDPLAVVPWASLAGSLRLQRQLTAARQALGRAAALNPISLVVLEEQILLALAEGDLGAARAALHTAPAGAQREAVIIYITNLDDLYWVLNDDEQRYLLGTSAADFAGDSASWLLTVADQHSYRGEVAQARAWGIRAAQAYAASIAVDSNIFSIALQSVALAYAGRKAESSRLAEQTIRLRRPISVGADNGPRWQFELVRAYLLLGEPEKALDALEPLLRIPSFLTPAWLRIDPTFAPLHGNPRFERLASER